MGGADLDEPKLFAQTVQRQDRRSAVTIVDAEELGGTMMKNLTEPLDEDMDAAWARAAGERAAIVV